MPLSCLLALLALFAGPTSKPPSAAGEYRAPDRTLTAVVIPLKQLGIYGINPSGIQIRNSKGRLVASRDHSHLGQGLTIVRAGWTRDSRFFVYQVEDSGGHNPWRKPTFLFSRAKRRFYYLDEVLRALSGSPSSTVIGSMHLSGRSTFVAEAWYRGKPRPGLRVSELDNSDQLVVADLRKLEKQFPRSAISSDAIDRKLERDDR